MTPKTKKRPLKAVVISDVHLGTYGCKAEQLHAYLKTIRPEILVLNGDIIDAWRFTSNYFPTAHFKVVRYFFKLAEEGCKIIYIPGNHDEVARRFTDLEFGQLQITNKIVLTLDGKTSWIFHGDVFDVVMHNSKWLAKLGSVGYGLLMAINRLVNGVIKLFGGKKISLAAKIKDVVKGGKHQEITKFESTVARLAIRKGYDYAICGHIHRPAKKNIITPSGSVIYLNSGDWVDNMTALEYEKGDWYLKRWDEGVEDITEESAVEEILTETAEEAFKRAFKEIIRS
ncbi:MAG TPA: UDP-2,3-diacylglucosamine hydrolase [Marinilabiliaceae bacterium]|nr:UDP-2,3-diacylglucosamine hydrolase [Marinilabiliaceae bacterium]HBX88934.1 UDP-2,3-diacylglucosamine hydrolase [Marinilabiliaceae bacterium]